MEQFQLKSYQFRREREKTWRELEAMLAQVERRGLRSLSADELSRLPELYRAALSSLSVARAISLDRNALDYLESLCMRAYYVVYGPKSTLWQIARSFFLVSFPQSVRGAWLYVLVATAIFMLAAVAAYLVTDANPDRYYSFVGEGMAEGRDPAASEEELLEALFAGEDQDQEDLAFFSTWLFTHNSQSGILIFAVSIVPFLLVFYLLWMNGAILGAMSWLHHEKGLALEWYSWILPHGVTELLAILLCGGAGLVVGQAILFPGRHGRLESLRRRGGDAGFMVVGAVFMLFFAGVIEGVFRQRVQDLGIRYGLALATSIFWMFYFGWVGRSKA